MAPETISVLDQWYRYEEIAMHFNNLIMQFRLQLLGGIGLMGTIASYLIGGKMRPNNQQHRVAAIFSAGLAVLLAAVASLDLLYYSRLLDGAVRALVEFESKHREIQMSTRIEEIVGWGKYSVWMAYGIVILFLGLFSRWSFRQHQEGLTRHLSRRRAKEGASS
jgi:hypothetical protein